MNYTLHNNTGTFQKYADTAPCLNSHIIGGWKTVLEKLIGSETNLFTRTS